MVLEYFKRLEVLFILQGIVLSFLFRNGIISILITTISLIGIVLLYHSIKYFSKVNVKEKLSQNKTLFDLIGSDNLKGLKDFLKTNKVKVNQMHTMIYYAQVTPIIYAMDKEAYAIFCFLLENGYDLNAKDVGHPPLLFAAYYPHEKYIEEMLKYPIDFSVTNNAKYLGNALEIAIWRGRTRVVKALLAHGMRFSLTEYKNSKCGKELLPWDKVTREIKVLLLENYVFYQKKKKFYLNEICLQKKLSIPLFNAKHYFIENLLTS